MEIVDLSAHELAREARAGRVSAKEIVCAHIARAEAADRELNAVVVRLFDEAVAIAARSDAQYRSGESVGPMHGVPVTVKECFDVAGKPSTVGVGEMAATVATRDSALVEGLRNAGAILLGKTNLPQLMWFGETDNPVYGRSANPWNLARSPGGSSGGEGAIIAAGGAPLGFGTDSGGSVRTPAHFCGISALKPTDRRLSMAGTVDDRLLSGWEGVLSQAGPLARSVTDLAFVMDVLARKGAMPYDPVVPPVPWRDHRSVPIASLRIGKVTDGLVAPAPAIARVVNEAADALHARGADIVEFTLPDLHHALSTYDRIFSADGGATLGRALGASEQDWRIRRILAKMQREGPLPLPDYAALITARTDYRVRFVRELHGRKIDLLISPPYPVAALPHGMSLAEELNGANMYTAFANLVGLPAGVVAASRVRPDEELCGTQRGALRTIGIGSAGLPVGVQVIGHPWREDIVLAAMIALEEDFRAARDYPTTPCEDWHPALT